MMQRKRFLRKNLVALLATGFMAGVVGVVSVDVPAYEITDATWSFMDDGSINIDARIETPLAEGDTITLSFPDNVELSQASGYATITGQNRPLRRNDTINGRIVLTCDTTVIAPLVVRITLDEVFTEAYPTHQIHAIAIAVHSESGARRAYGVAMPDQGLSTNVQATVPLSAVLGVSTRFIQLGVLSPQSVAQQKQTYYINTNNATGIRLQIAADGPLRSPTGDVIEGVVDGSVTAGSAEYGVSVQNVRNIDVNGIFTSGDVAVSTSDMDLSVSDTPVHGGSFDMIYKASIDGEAVAGRYQQTLFFTFSSNT